LTAPEANGNTSNTAAGVTNTTNAARKTGVDLSLQYANGPLYVGFGYNKQDTGDTTNNGLVGAANIITNTAGPRTDYTLSASYDFGVAQPFFNYTNRNDASTNNTITGGVVTAQNTTTLNALGAAAGNGGSNTKSNQYALGVKVPFGAATLITSFGNHKTTGSAAVLGGLSTDSVERKVRAFQIGGTYSLSKRTSFMANFGLNNTEDKVRNVVNAGGSTLTETTTKSRGLNVGVSHLF
jgi:predicted porin